MTDKDPRYPYTHACDYLRVKIGNDWDKGLISRSAASQARSIIAEVLGMDDYELACKLADEFYKMYPQGG
jgi:hypothetical protein